MRGLNFGKAHPSIRTSGFKGSRKGGCFRVGGVRRLLLLIVGVLTLLHKLLHFC